MTPSSDSRSVLILVEQAYNDLELWYPKIRLEEAGMRVVVAGPERIHAGKCGYPRTPADLPDFCRELIAALRAKITA